MLVDDNPGGEAGLVDLLIEQVPEWSMLPLRRLTSSGTDNALYRLGDNLLLRIPRRPSAAGFMSKVLDYLPLLKGLSLEVPNVRYRGRTRQGFEFGIFDWMDGQIALPVRIESPIDAALALAHFLKEMHEREAHRAPLAGEGNGRRGVALELLSEVTLKSIDILSDEIDASGAREVWRRACAAPYEGHPIWLHGDLKADNLLVRNGSLCGVIDWDMAAVGDPAIDYASAWTWVEPPAREVFLTACEIDDHDRIRAQGWALYCAVIALSFYRGGKNDALCAQSRLTLSRLGLLEGETIDALPAALFA